MIPPQVKIHCSPASTGTTAPPISPPPEVSFLGMKVSLLDAEVALNTLFSLTIIGTVSTVLMSYMYFRATKRSQCPPGENIGLVKRS